MTVNITPLHDRVLVRRLEEKETAKGGIIIPIRPRKNLKRAK
jgi:co-chaperonin GroES (HSP10)